MHCRVGDTYPNQILDPIVRAYVYRWTDKPTAKQHDYKVTPLLSITESLEPDVILEYPMNRFGGGTRHRCARNCALRLHPITSARVSMGLIVTKYRGVPPPVL